jgi:hypothetical protein
MDRRYQGLGAQIGARIAAALVAVAAWTGLALRFDASLVDTGSAVAAGWALLRFFTIVANLFVAILFVAVALDPRRPKPATLAAALLAILLVGIVYHLLLAGRAVHVGVAWWADLVMHSVTPSLVPLYWLGFAPKGGLRASDPLRWAVLPLGYFAYALARGAIDGRYPYFFMDVARIGWLAVLGWAALIACCFLVGGALLVVLDRTLGRALAARRIASGEHLEHNPPL